MDISDLAFERPDRASPRFGRRTPRRIDLGGQRRRTFPSNVLVVADVAIAVASAVTILWQLSHINLVQNDTGNAMCLRP